MSGPVTGNVNRTRAIALYSGGLDSTLAVLAVMRQGIEVKAITFLNHFGCDISDRSSCSKDPFAASAKFGFEVKLCHLSEQFIEIVKHPKFGHGRNMNPCMDCRILMLQEAKEFMQMTGAAFIITGEVLGQRPDESAAGCARYYRPRDRAARQNPETSQCKNIKADSGRRAGTRRQGATLRLWRPLAKASDGSCARVRSDRVSFPCRRLSAYGTELLLQTARTLSSMTLHLH